MRIRTLDLFAGCGGSSYGARMAGASIVGAVDAWGLATETYRANFPGSKVIAKRLEDISPKSLRKEIGPIDLLLASPECTNHTCAKGSARRSETSRKTAFQVLRFAREFKPRWLVIENVTQMRQWRRYRRFLAELEECGYKLTEQVLDAKDFGVPQTRRRLFILGDREAEPKMVVPRKPRRPPTIQRVLDGNGKWKFRPLLSESRANNTIVRYLTGLERVGPSKPFLLVYYGSDGGGGWQRLDRPLRTVTTVDRFGLVDPDPDGPRIRMLQVPELQRAMGFGRDFKLNGGSRRDRIKLLGNAVCPPVLAAVVRSLASYGSLRRPAKRRVNGRVR